MVKYAQYTTDNQSLQKRIRCHTLNLLAQIIHKIKRHKSNTTDMQHNQEKKKKKKT